MTTHNSYRIAVNTRLLLAGKMEGIGWFEYQILKRWVANYPQHRFFFIFDRPYSNDFVFENNVTPIILGPPARHPILWYIWYEWQIPRLLKRLDADIFLSFDTYTSVRAKVKKMTAIHDVAFALFDNQMDSLSQRFLRYFTPKYIACSDAIVTVSDRTAEDLVNYYKCPKEKIVIAHNAPSEVYKPLSAEIINEFKQRHTDGNDFFVYVGSIHPRKNVINILRSFEIFKGKHKTNYKLILIGRMAWKYDTEKEFLDQMQYRSDVILVPHSNPENIAKWVASATALILVSHYEGFGVPLVEAMACHVPVITSNIPPMSSIAGQSGIHVSPHDANELAEAMNTFSSNPEYRDQCIEVGREKVKDYNWDSAAQMIWDELENIIHH